MKIASSEIAMSANYQQSHSVEEQEQLEEWIGDRRGEQQLPKGLGDKLELSNSAKELQSLNSEEELYTSLDPHLQQIVRALEILTGKKIKIAFFKPGQNGSAGSGVQHPDNNEQPQRVGWGVDYSYERTEIKKQSLEFAASGDVRTEDGKKIDFQLAFSMQQTEISHESVSLKAGDALIDPLVIQFGGGAVNFSNIKTNLDLDLDGKAEEFAFVGSGSGFLTLDKNGDGKVNDGSELFGPNSGDGFEDLRKYDQDSNSWIDENDAVFEKLKIWTKDQEGNESFYSLKDLGIGALYLENITTPFSFEAGELAKSSLFLKEDGSAGSISEVDLRV